FQRNYGGGGRRTFKESVATTRLSKISEPSFRSTEPPDGEGKLEAGFDEAAGRLDYTDPQVRHNPCEAPNRRAPADARVMEIAEVDHRPRGGTEEHPERPDPDHALDADAAAVRLGPACPGHPPADQRERLVLAQPEQAGGAADHGVPRAF